jgi:hypothetical protein
MGMAKALSIRHILVPESGITLCQLDRKTYRQMKLGQWEILHKMMVTEENQLLKKGQVMQLTQARWNEIIHGKIL